MSTTEDRIDIIDLQPSNGKCFLVPTEIATKRGPIRIKTLLDSGASGQFINPDLVQRLNLPKYPLKNTINIYNADGSHNKDRQCSHYTKIKIKINDRVMTIKPKIVTLGTKPLFWVSHGYANKTLTLIGKMPHSDGKTKPLRHYNY